MVFNYLEECLENRISGHNAMALASSSRRFHQSRFAVLFLSFLLAKSINALHFFRFFQDVSGNDLPGDNSWDQRDHYSTLSMGYHHQLEFVPSYELFIPKSGIRYGLKDGFLNAFTESS